MNEYEIFQKTLSKLHASDDTLQKVLNKAHSSERRPITPKRVAVLVAVMVALFSMMLVVQGSLLLADRAAILTPAQDPGKLIDDAFSDKISTQKPEMFDTKGNPIALPDMERPAADLAEAERLIGQYINDVNGVVSVGENTFTLKSFLIDETGTGALTWTVENPNGIPYGDAGYGTVYFSPIAPFGEPMLYHYGADGHRKKMACDFTALISKNEDGTMLELVSYFGTFDHYEIGDHFVWEVCSNNRCEKETIQITPMAHIPVKTMTAEEGLQLWISNHSITLNLNRPHNEMNFKKIVIHFKDGSQYCLEDWENLINNSSGAFIRSSEEYFQDDDVHLFNRIIDINKVSFVETMTNVYENRMIEGKAETLIHQETYLFYP